MHASALVAALRVAQTQAEWIETSHMRCGSPVKFPSFELFFFSSALPRRSGASDPVGLRHGRSELRPIEAGPFITSVLFFCSYSKYSLGVLRGSD